MRLGQVQSKSAMGLKRPSRLFLMRVFEGASGTGLLLELDDVLEDLGGTESTLGSEGQDVVEMACRVVHAELVEVIGEGSHSLFSGGVVRRGRERVVGDQGVQ